MSLPWATSRDGTHLVASAQVLQDRELRRRWTSPVSSNILVLSGNLCPDYFYPLNVCTDLQASLNGSSIL